MKALGSLLISVIVGIIVLWLLIKLVFFSFKLISLAIVVAVIAGTFFVVRKLIDGPR
jgi:hypothetical protein